MYLTVCLTVFSIVRNIFSLSWHLLKIQTGTLDITTDDDAYYFCFVAVKFGANIGH